MKKDSVDFRLKEYEASLPDWELVADVCMGETRIKDKGTDYLPKPNPQDRSATNSERYKNYLARAVFYNATSRTLDSLVGSAFTKWPVLEVPEPLEYVSDDIDGKGVSIYQQSQQTLADVLKKGRHALFVDYPTVQGGVSIADINSGQVRPTVCAIDAENVINWRETRVGSNVKLSMVVIREEVQDYSGLFETAEVEQYRVLLLEEGFYKVQLWRKLEQDISDDWYLFEEFIPTTGSGQKWTEIPFTFVGSNNNDSSVDKSPLVDLAKLNIAHYRNSADYEDSVYFVGQAQAWISGLTEDWRDWMIEQGLYIGSRTPILLPEGGGFGIVQAQPNTLAKEAMDQKEKQMVALGARLIEQGQAVKTATEAQADNEAEQSVLSLCASNVSEAYSKALDWAAMFLNLSPQDISYEINQDYSQHRLDSQMLATLVSSWQAGVLPNSDLWANLKRYGVIDPEKEDQDIEDELSTSSIGLGLDDGI